MAAELDRTNCEPAGPGCAAWPETVPEPNCPPPELADDPDPNWDGMDWGTGTGVGTVPGVGMAGWDCGEIPDTGTLDWKFILGFVFEENSVCEDAAQMCGLGFSRRWEQRGPLWLLEKGSAQKASKGGLQTQRNADHICTT